MNMTPNELHWIVIPHYSGFDQGVNINSMFCDYAKVDNDIEYESKFSMEGYRAEYNLLVAGNSEKLGIYGKEYEVKRDCFEMNDVMTSSQNSLRLYSVLKDMPFGYLGNTLYKFNDIPSLEKLDAYAVIAGGSCFLCTSSLFEKFSNKTDFDIFIVGKTKEKRKVLLKILLEYFEVEEAELNWSTVSFPSGDRQIQLVATSCTDWREVLLSFDLSHSQVGFIPTFPTLQVSKAFLFHTHNCDTYINKYFTHADRLVKMLDKGFKIKWDMPRVTFGQKINSKGIPPPSLQYYNEYYYIDYNSNRDGIPQPVLDFFLKYTTQEKMELIFSEYIFGYKELSKYLGDGIRKNILKLMMYLRNYIIMSNSGYLFLKRMNKKESTLSFYFKRELSGIRQLDRDTILRKIAELNNMKYSSQLVEYNSTIEYTDDEIERARIFIGNKNMIENLKQNIFESNNRIKSLGMFIRRCTDDRIEYEEIIKNINNPIISRSVLYEVGKNDEETIKNIKKYIAYEDKEIASYNLELNKLKKDIKEFTEKISKLQSEYDNEISKHPLNDDSLNKFQNIYNEHKYTRYLIAGTLKYKDNKIFAIGKSKKQIKEYKINRRKTIVYDKGRWTVDLSQRNFNDLNVAIDITVKSGTALVIVV